SAPLPPSQKALSCRSPVRSSPRLHLPRTHEPTPINGLLSGLGRFALFRIPFIVLGRLRLEGITLPFPALLLFICGFAPAPSPSPPPSPVPVCSCGLDSRPRGLAPFTKSPPSNFTAPAMDASTQRPPAVQRTNSVSSNRSSDSLFPLDDYMSPNTDSHSVYVNEILSNPSKLAPLQGQYQGYPQNTGDLGTSALSNPYQQQPTQYPAPYQQSQQSAPVLARSNSTSSRISANVKRVPSKASRAASQRPATPPSGRVTPQGMAINSMLAELDILETSSQQGMSPAAPSEPSPPRPETPTRISSVNANSSSASRSGLTYVGPTLASLMPAAIRSAYMGKLSNARTQSSGSSVWKRRFFVIHNYRVYVFRSHQASETAISFIQINNNTSVYPCMGDSSMCLNVQTEAPRMGHDGQRPATASERAERLWTLQFTERDEYVIWLEILRSLAQTYPSPDFSEVAPRAADSVPAPVSVAAIPPALSIVVPSSVSAAPYSAAPYSVAPYSAGITPTSALPLERSRSAGAALAQYYGPPTPQTVTPQPSASLYQQANASVSSFSSTAYATNPVPYSLADASAGRGTPSSFASIPAGPSYPPSAAVPIQSAYARAIPSPSPSVYATSAADSAPISPPQFSSSYTRPSAMPAGAGAGAGVGAALARSNSVSSSQFPPATRSKSLSSASSQYQEFYIPVPPSQKRAAAAAATEGSSPSSIATSISNTQVSRLSVYTSSSAGTGAAGSVRLPFASPLHDDFATPATPITPSGSFPTPALPPAAPLPRLENNIFATNANNKKKKQAMQTKIQIESLMPIAVPMGRI
ncbi:uncharacterized protein BJ171DRAFT_55222, partial [Polychytrium aggregatum]|uniref:uncharacterized protein n=1 Tax=Polychytrium aggregatum TaxID=110093 RepID=UPI0022FE320B